MQVLVALGSENQYFISVSIKSPPVLVYESINLWIYFML